MLRVSSRNARFQQWESLLGNRAKRQRNREFLVQGVRPISLAAEFGWPFRALLYDAERQLSAWARTLLRDVPALQVAMSPGLLADLGEKEAGPAGAGRRGRDASGRPGPDHGRPGLPRRAA